MKSVYNILMSFAESLENENNDAMVAADKNDETLAITAEICAQAAMILRNGAEEVKYTEQSVCENCGAQKEVEVEHLCEHKENCCKDCECDLSECKCVDLDGCKYCLDCAKKQLEKLESETPEETQEQELATEASRIEELVKLANMLDATEDPELIKKASVLDALLQTMVSPNKKKDKNKEASYIKEIQDRIKKGLPVSEAAIGRSSGNQRVK